MNVQKENYLLIYMIEWILFALICYSIGLVTGFIGVVAVFLYAMKHVKQRFKPPKTTVQTKKFKVSDEILGIYG